MKKRTYVLTYNSEIEASSKKEALAIAKREIAKGIAKIDVETKKDNVCAACGHKRSLHVPTSDVFCHGENSTCDCPVYAGDGDADAQDPKWGRHKV